MFDETGWELAV